MKIKLLLVHLIFFGFTAQVFAQNFGGPQDLVDKLKRSVELPSQGQLEIVAIKETPLPQIFEVELNTGELLYSDISGDYCLLYTSPSPRDGLLSRMPSSA